MVSRLTPLKRADLLVEALRTAGGGAGIRAVIAGDGEERDRLAGAASRELGLADRVTLAGRLDDAELLDHLARCRAVCFPPFEEDYGFVTVEAFASRKAVVTCRDSGGPAELVEDGVNGFVASRPRSARDALRRADDEALHGAWAMRRSLPARDDWADAVVSYAIDRPDRDPSCDYGFVDDGSRAAIDRVEIDDQRSSIHGIRHTCLTAARNAASRRRSPRRSPTTA